MGKSIRLNLHGLQNLGPKTQSEVLVRIRHTMGPLVKAAGKTLIITTGKHRGDINLDFDSETATFADGMCPPGERLFGEDGGEAVFVKAHRELRVCGPPDPVSGKRDTRKVLTTFWLLGPALANTALHELGHFIADLEDVSDMSNYMSTLEPMEKRTLMSRRTAKAGKQTFTEDQKDRLVKQLKEEKWLLEMTSKPGP